MNNRHPFTTLLGLSWLIAVLAACTSPPPSCYSIADLERLPEAGFRPPQTERVFYETSDGAAYVESSYFGITLATMGSALDPAALIRTYDDYLKPRQWIRLDIDENEVL